MSTRLRGRPGGLRLWPGHRRPVRAAADGLCGDGDEESAAGQPGAHLPAAAGDAHPVALCDHLGGGAGAAGGPPLRRRRRRPRVGAADWHQQSEAEGIGAVRSQLRLLGHEQVGCGHSVHAGGSPGRFGFFVFFLWVGGHFCVLNYAALWLISVLFLCGNGLLNGCY